MTLGEEMQKALQEARASAKALKATKEMDELERDIQERVKLQPIVLALRELKKCFYNTNDIFFDESGLQYHRYCIQLKTISEYNRTIIYKISIQIVSLHYKAPYYDISIEQLASSSRYYIKFSLGEEDKVIMSCISLISYFEINGNLYGTVDILKHLGTVTY